jgi:hypothetical protein
MKMADIACAVAILILWSWIIAETITGALS